LTQVDIRNMLDAPSVVYVGVYGASRGGRTTMRRTVRIRFWIEAVLASLTAGLSVLTLISREWIEVLFGVDPDAGDGSLEWAIVAALAVATVVVAWLARAEWRRAASQET
jgi:hypothetical protein